jgi:hypothetical protein
MNLLLKEEYAAMIAEWGKKDLYNKEVQFARIAEWLSKRNNINITPELLIEKDELLKQNSSQIKNVIVLEQEVSLPVAFGYLELTYKVQLIQIYPETPEDDNGKIYKLNIITTSGEIIGLSFFFDYQGYSYHIICDVNNLVVAKEIGSATIHFSNEDIMWDNIKFGSLNSLQNNKKSKKDNNL